MKKYFFAFALIIIAATTSCNYVEERSVPNVKAISPPQNDEITTVAVLPFKNETEKKNVEDILRKSFFNNLSSKGYKLLKLEEVDERLNLAAITASNIDKEDIYKVGKIVKADSIIYGKITKCSKSFFGIYSQVILAAELKMVDAKSYKIIWQAEHTEKTHSDAIPLSPFSIPEAVVESSMNVRDKVIIDTADRLVKKFMTRIPSKGFTSPIGAGIVSIRPNGASTEIHYKVQADDTLPSIALKFYDDTLKAENILNANSIANGALQAGQELIIPDVPILADIDECHLIDKNRHKRAVYRVKWGDSLYSLASKVFNDGKKWILIQDANRHEIQDIKDLPVGQVIIIPLIAPKPDTFKKKL